MDRNNAHGFLEPAMVTQLAATINDCPMPVAVQSPTLHESSQLPQTLSLIHISEPTRLDVI
eukprot:7632042-Prorocentrum_lima.AAC.1